MTPIYKLDQAVSLLVAATADMAAQGVPSTTLRQLKSLTDDLIGYISDLPSVIAEDTFEDGANCIGCAYLASIPQRLPYGDRYTVRVDCECTAPGASDCPVVKRVYGD